MDEVAAILGASATTIRRCLDDVGVARRPAFVPVEVDVAQLVSGYLAGATMLELAVELAMSEDAVRTRLLGAGVTPRPQQRRPRP